MSKNLFVKPVLKWVGGKRQLLDDIIPLIPKNISTYVEPFIGGGAILFELQPDNAVINDYNEELINVYNVIKNNPDELLSKLEIHKSNNDEKYFYSVREMDRDPEGYKNLSNIERAARIIYLNKTCYNGLFRVNMSGQFNTPYGKYKNPNIVNKPTIKAVSRYFTEKDVSIFSGDYAEVLKDLDHNSFVYLDPPYMPVSSSSSFTGYTQTGFDLEEQIRLKNECDKLDIKGIKFVQSNSDTEYLRELYSEYNIITITAKRSINSKGNKRGDVNELLIHNLKR